MIFKTCTGDTFGRHALSTADVSTRYGCNREKTLPAIGIVPVTPDCKQRSEVKIRQTEDHWLPGKIF